jgi:IS30 family transposase
MKETNRSNLTAYLAEQRHLRGDLRCAKTLTQMAAELGTTKSTVRRWLRRDHWDLWMEHWASVEEIWEARQQERSAARLVQPRRDFQITLEEFCASYAADDGNSLTPTLTGRPLPR